ncbi:hypothetical protein HZB01_02815 [Candidatus Woesearchaeota archaeon]|nr:hypothetical protein [Candidatus Woesearchaeota archaeon]
MNKTLVLLLLLMVSAGLITGCEKKEPPLIPLPYDKVAVENQNQSALENTPVLSIGDGIEDALKELDAVDS